jgi:hypothetical protein
LLHVHHPRFLRMQLHAQCVQDPEDGFDGSLRLADELVTTR